MKSEHCIIGKLLVCVLPNKNCLGGEVKGIEMDEDCSTRGELIDVCYVLFGAPEGKIS